MESTDPRLAGKRRTGPDRKLTAEEEANVIARYERGDKIQEIADDAGISTATIYTIRRRIMGRAVDASQDAGS